MKSSSVKEIPSLEAIISREFSENSLPITSDERCNLELNKSPVEAKREIFSEREATGHI